jgi:hypothetical protein
VLEVAGIAPGSTFAQGFSLSPNSNNMIGEATIGQSASSFPPPSATNGQILIVTFNVKPTAPSGPSTIVLANSTLGDIIFTTIPATNLNNGTVTVNGGSNNTSPSLDPIGNKTIEVGSNLNFTVTAMDPESDPLTLSAAPLPSGANFTDNGDGTGVFNWTPTGIDAGPHSVTFRAEDTSGLFDEEMITITVDVQQPGTRFGLIWQEKYGDSSGDQFNSFAWDQGHYVLAAGHYEGTYPNRPASQQGTRDGLLSFINIFDKSEMDADLVFPHTDNSSITDIEIDEQGVNYAGVFTDTGVVNVNPLLTPTDIRSGRTNADTGFVAGFNRIPAAYRGSNLIQPEEDDARLEIKDIVQASNNQLYVGGTFSGKYNFDPDSNTCNFSFIPLPAWCVNSTDVNTQNGFIAKYDGSTMDFQWVYTFGIPKTASANGGGTVNAIAVNPVNGDAAAAGQVFPTSLAQNYQFPQQTTAVQTVSLRDGAVVVLNSNGVLQLATTFGYAGQAGETNPTDITFDQNGDFVVVGDFNGELIFNQSPAVMVTMTNHAMGSSVTHAYFCLPILMMTVVPTQSATVANS